MRSHPLANMVADVRSNLEHFHRRANYLPGLLAESNDEGRQGLGFRLVSRHYPDKLMHPRAGCDQGWHNA